MAVERFTWCPDKGASLTDEMRVKTSKFGDGYGQSTPDGINNHKEVWKLTFDRNASEIAAIRGFVLRHRGANPFVWQSLSDGTDKLFTATDLSIGFPGGNSRTLSVTFNQYFAP